MKNWFLPSVITCSALLITALTTPAHSDPLTETADVHLKSKDSDSDHPAWGKFASGPGNEIFLAAATLLPLASHKANGKDQVLRTIDALVISTALTEGLKSVTHEQRPDDSDNKSFPSGHASAAFTVATMQAHYHPGQALLWYGGATAIAASRVVMDKHYIHDVVAGAALGYFTARLELKQKRGFLLRPFIRDEGAHDHVEGVSIGRSF